eukprot:scaffold1860_cov403-Prasinococcus_capsulatus_cf.AAC.9
MLCKVCTAVSIPRWLPPPLCRAPEYPRSVSASQNHREQEVSNTSDSAIPAWPARQARNTYPLVRSIPEAVDRSAHQLQHRARAISRRRYSI